eukprot:TRINITY_DN8373_c0_g1_i3.p1 TRINITY_DN8373_c0_g1~~TRINITY_DN8373_c0_g1_i3.p1  ORF type:complete len:253 (+),score=18.26 TRINITY_DN8373_c0_g1_i3:1843-2601(+)
MSKIFDQHGWQVDKVANKAVKAYNSALHKATGSTPNMRWYGREIWDKAERKIMSEQKPNTSIKGATKVYKVGDPVAHRNLNRNKFSDPRWLGPARIVELGQFDSYWIQHGDKTFKRNFQDIKLWTAKISSKTILQKMPVEQVDPTRVIPSTPIVKVTAPVTAPSIQDNPSPRSPGKPPNSNESPVKQSTPMQSPTKLPIKAARPIPKKPESKLGQESIPDKSSMSETFRSIGLPDLVYECKLKRLADKRKKT